jgi:hypothetical protein
VKRLNFLTTPLKVLFTSQKKDASVLVLTIALMLLFSGQILMVGMVTTKSLTESGALSAFSMAAREEAFGAMADFEAMELYPAYMRMVNDARSNTVTFTPISGQELLDNYGQGAAVRTDAVNNLAQRNWSTYRQRLWDPINNVWINGPFTTNVWFASQRLAGPDNVLNNGDDVFEWPFTIVARVQGNGVDQVLRRQTTMIPEGFRDS